jgi:L-serine deaminase
VVTTAVPQEILTGIAKQKVDLLLGVPKFAAAAAAAAVQWLPPTQMCKAAAALSLKLLVGLTCRGVACLLSDRTS